MWENRKLASWVVSFFCLLCTLTHMRKQCYGKCDFCHRQTRCSERGDDEKNGSLYTSQNFLPPVKTDYRQRHTNRKSHPRCFSRFLFSRGWDFLASLAGFPPEEESWSETAVSSTLRVLLCNRRTRYLLLFPLPACCFYTFSILQTGHHKRLTLLFNYCLTYSIENSCLSWTEEVKHAFESVLLIVAGSVFAAIWDYREGRK